MLFVRTKKNFIQNPYAIPQRTRRSCYAVHIFPYFFPLFMSCRCSDLDLILSFLWQECSSWSQLHEAGIQYRIKLDEHNRKPEDEGSSFLRNVVTHALSSTMSHPKDLNPYPNNKLFVVPFWNAHKSSTAQVSQYENRRALMSLKIWKV
jgi:hypothetical protein